jgi:peptide/nickel transport system substrate-binding protein
VKARISVIVAVAAAAALALSACSSGGSSTSSSSSNDATVNIGSVYEPQNLDNTAGGGQGVTEALNGNVYEGLFKLTDAGKVTKLLDKSYTVSPDGLTYTFTLRSGVKFHSGATLTSTDVKYSIDKVTAADSQSARKSDFAVVKTIATPNPTTVVITLSSKSISFVYNLSYIWIIDHTAKNLKTSEDGTGPYELDTWKHGSSLSLKRFPDYWGTPAKNKEAVFFYYKDATAENNALLTGAVDVVTSEQSPDALTQFANNSAYKINNGHSTTKLLLAFNDKKAPFNNVLVRTAITQGIDDKKLLSSIWGKYGTLTGSMVPPTDPWYENLTGVHPYDPTLAKQELAQAGYAKGLSFTLDTPNYDPHPAAAQFIKSSLAKIGVTVNINIITADQWYTKVYQNHDFVATMQEHVNDRDVVFYGNPDFYWGYDNPKVTALINQAEQSNTTAEQTADLKKANEQIVADAASDWLYLYPQIVVASTKISGYPLNGLNSQFYTYDIVKKS